ncbi:hypothetical protein MTP99_007448 [Tenebrio molitor]|nr:hypothetical protein MTP99_007448 [Tenebrio molitor]
MLLWQHRPGSAAATAAIRAACRARQPAAPFCASCLASGTLPRAPGSLNCENMTGREFFPIRRIRRERTGFKGWPGGGRKRWGLVTRKNKNPRD